MIKIKEPTSALLHFLGIVFSIAALVILLLASLDSPWKVISSAIFGTTLILLYTFSTLYHTFPLQWEGKNQLWRKLDHIAIYLLIAGTYTPFCLVTIRGPWGWTLFGIAWGLALIGITMQSIYINANRIITTLIYFGMGWMVVIVIRPLSEALPLNAIYLLIAAGAVYTLGGIIYAFKKPNLGKYFGFHELWHIFVLSGSFLDFLAIYLYVIKS
ncbi:MAG: hemolysin III family protein [Candidatus Saganbacteria bacterium]|nr:hemolysin III family protein [Candidatus Saganbacteria bacterium]